PLDEGGTSNAQSAAFAVQALVASGRRAGRALAYLRSLTTGSGLVRYSRGSAQTPVWVTAQALTAFARRPFPVAAVPRRAHHHHHHHAARAAAAPPAPVVAAAAAPSPA